MSLIPFDTASYADMYASSEFVGGAFASHPDAYAYLSHQLLDALVDAVRGSGVDQECQISASCVLFDIYMELQRVARIAIDLESIADSLKTAVYVPENNPLLRYLDTGEGSVAQIAAKLARHSTTGENAPAIKDWLRCRRRDLKLMLTPRRNRMDILARGPLIENYLQQSGKSAIDIHPYSIPWKEPGTPDEGIRHLAKLLVDVSVGLLGNYIESPLLLERTRAWSLVFAIARLNQTHAAYLLIHSMSFRHFLSPVLLTGAPKTFGRLISHLYQTTGRQVYRFAHGGERAFYDDYYWGLCELPYCDRYFGHGVGEAINLQRRFSEKRILNFSARSPEFSSLGSERHKTIYEKCLRGPDRQAKQRTKRIMFVTASLLGERMSDTIAVKPPDVQGIDLEAHICRQLRDAGYHVTIKLHPKGIDDTTGVRNRFGDEAFTGFFDASTNDYDCFIFSYAGSAFFDALASGTGIVLIDAGIRKIDRNARSDLDSRCEIVSASCDSSNRFGVDREALIHAVENAAQSRGCPEAFFKKYFEGDEE